VRGYLRRIEPEQLQSLRFAVVGAEKCPADLRRDFRERYGKPLLEGYGATELAPAVCVNTLAHQRDGSVGRPLPGVEVYTLDPATRERLPTGEGGVLVVRSPARMAGYLHRDDLTRQAFMGDAYFTGDMGRMDADGYVYITGRLARFAKIAGEMVPLDLIEERLQAAVQATHGDAYDVAVAAVADARRGERVIVLHTGVPGDPEAWLGALNDLPNLFKPRPRDVFVVEAIPVLGTGKRDLGGVKRLAAAMAAGMADQPELAYNAASVGRKGGAHDYNREP
jgi:acyl-[acyl-carrier-protein]-phospholipid O-acyltransferase / long-chain-fatty-acid--[acyl-carrier-protein] ligase